MINPLVKQVRNIRYIPFYNNKRKVIKGIKRNTPKVMKRKRNICMNISTNTI